MARFRRSPAVEKTHAESIKRSARLCRLVSLVAGKGASRALLLRRLRLDVRTFYRALEALREVGVVVELKEGKYVLAGDADAAVDRLPFPDPQLSLGEARQLGKGRGAVHRKIKAILAEVLPK